MRCKVTVIVDAVLVATFLAPWRVKLLMDEADNRGYISNKTTGSSLKTRVFLVKVVNHSIYNRYEKFVKINANLLR